MISRAIASAPATAANLGPAFDRLALAIELRCAVTAELADEWSIEHTGEFRIEPGEEDKVLAAARRAVGEDRPLRMTVSNDIPIAKGLGSSGASLSAGAAAALAAVEGEAHPDQVYRIAADIEGHDDNVAASVYGGLILVPAEGLPIRLLLHPSLHPIVAVPDFRQPTPAARAVIDKSHSHEVTLRTIARVAALTAGLLTADAELLAAAHGDEIHEAPRARISPEVEQVIAVARGAGALHAARSGAGPTVIVLTTSETVGRVSEALTEHGSTVIDRPVAASGLVVTTSE